MLTAQLLIGTSELEQKYTITKLTNLSQYERHCILWDCRKMYVACILGDVIPLDSDICVVLTQCNKHARLPAQVPNIM